MLHFVQQFEGKWLQIEDHRPKCCTFYNFKPKIGFIPPFLLYKIQHLVILKNWTEPSGEFFNTEGDDR